jgi:hypothetical protein
MICARYRLKQSAIGTSSTLCLCWSTMTTNQPRMYMSARLCAGDGFVPRQSCQMNVIVRSFGYQQYAVLRASGCIIAMGNRPRIRTLSVPQASAPPAIGVGSRLPLGPRNKERAHRCKRRDNNMRNQTQWRSARSVLRMFANGRGVERDGFHAKLNNCDQRSLFC